MKIFCQKSIIKFPLTRHNHISARPPHTISASTRCWCSQVSQVVAMVLLFTKHVLLASQSEGGMKWKILFNWILHVKFDSHWNAVAKSDLQFSRRGGKRYCAEGWQYIGRARRIVQVGVIVLSCFSKHRVLLLPYRLLQSIWFVHQAKRAFSFEFGGTIVDSALWPYHQSSICVDQEYDKQLNSINWTKALSNSQEALGPNSKQETRSLNIY